MEEMLQSVLKLDMLTAENYLGFLRVVAPVLCGLLLLRCFTPLLTFRREPEIWAWLG